MGKGQMDLRIEQTHLECLRECEDCHGLNVCEVGQLETGFVAV